MTFDNKKIQESKELRRQELAKLPFIEKLRILDQMRERDLFIRSARKAKRAPS